MRAHPVPVARPRGQARRRRPDEHADGRRQDHKRPRRRRYQRTIGTLSNRNELYNGTIIPDPDPSFPVQVRRAAQVRHLGQGSRAARTTRATTTPTADARPAQGRRRRSRAVRRASRTSPSSACAHPPTATTAATPWSATATRSPTSPTATATRTNYDHDGPDGHARRRQHVHSTLLPQSLAAIACTLCEHHGFLPAQRACAQLQQVGRQYAVRQHTRHGVEPGKAQRVLLPAVRGRALQEDALLPRHEPRAVPGRFTARLQVPRLQRRRAKRRRLLRERKRHYQRLRLRHVLWRQSQPRYVGAADRHRQTLFGVFLLS